VSDWTPKRESGVVLLLTLFILAVAATLMATTARYALKQSLDADDVRNELQRRWGQASIESILEEAPRIFAEAGTSEKFAYPNPLPRCSFELGQLEVELVFTDEQSKANLNQALAREDRLALEKRLRDLTRDLDGRPLIRLRPLDPMPGDGQHASEGSAMFKPLVTWSQVAGRSGVNQPKAGESRLGLADVATLWGSGRLNLRRASPESIDVALGAWLRPSQRQILRNALSDGSAPSLSEIPSRLDLDEKQREQLGSYLAEDETCYGVWTTFRNERRAWRTFAVAANPGGQPPSAPSRLHRIVWP